MKKGISIIAALLILVSCKKNSCQDATNPKCDNYNPCAAVHPLSADFSIYEDDCTQGPGAYDTSWHYYPTDTVATNCATFAVNDTTVDSVKWQIGAGVYTQRSFYLDFTGQRQQPIAVTLTVYKHRNKCYPQDDTIKTLTRHLYFTDTCLALGVYKGYFNNNTSDTGTVAIQWVNTGTNPPNIIVSGFIPGCSEYYCCGTQGLGTVERFYKSISFTKDRTVGSCYGATGSLYYSPGNNKVLVSYKILGSNFTYIAYNFNGIKIN